MKQNHNLEEKKRCPHLYNIVQMLFWDVFVG